MLSSPVIVGLAIVGLAVGLFIGAREPNPKAIDLVAADTNINMKMVGYSEPLTRETSMVYRVMQDMNLSNQVRMLARDGSICREFGHRYVDGACVVCGLVEKQGCE